MEVIRAAVQHREDKPRKGVRADRQTLSKRRWRGMAEDGQELGFDLERPLADGDAVLETSEAVYVIEQTPEPVIGVRIADCGMQIEEAARIGWMLGNLHFPVEIAEGRIWTMDDPAVRQLMEREGIGYDAVERVFKPVKAAHGHAH